MSSSRPARYYVTIGESEYLIELDRRGDELTVMVDGQPVEADLVLIDEPYRHSLLLDGHSREMVIDREDETTFIYLDGHRWDARVQDELAHALSAIGSMASSGATQVVASMPGVVVAVPVVPGQEVQAGEPVIVVEAMKMQNELVAEADGVVESIHAGIGDTVDGGDVLVVFRVQDSP